MTINNDDILKSILDSLDRMSHIRSDDIPNIDLYMDQVTTFMDRHLRASARYPEEDKILTKTMINNYAKNDLLPSPVKKKYSKEHVLVLIFIYYFKGILSINDIKALLHPITEQYFGKETELSLEYIYDEVFSLEPGRIESLKKDIEKIYHESEKTFSDVEEKDRDFLQKFSFICMLSYDVYMKKLMIEKMIDEMRKDTEEEDK